MTSAVLALVGIAACLPDAAVSDSGTLRPIAGHPVPGFTVRTSEGGSRTLADETGRVVLVHFFATWCEPCRPEMASLDRLAARFSGADLTILAVSVAEPEARLSRFFAESPVRFPVLLDPDRKVSRAWQVEALPTTFLLARDGRARLHVRGDLDWQRPDVEAAVAALLAEGTGPNSPQNDPGHGGR